MGTYRCIRCTGSGDYESIEEARAKLDHSLGISKGRPCRGGDTAPIQEVVAESTQAAPAKAEKPKERTRETKASEK